MAKPKNFNNKKSKPAKHAGKKQGKQADLQEMRVQLDALGLKIVEVNADGNCLFRAIADQLEGNQEEHEKYRKMVVQYILDNRLDFEPFIEDDVPFVEYCRTMEKDGTWAGNLELQAASLVTRRNICIHLLGSPRWCISNFSNDQVDMMHLSYHDGEHYNSVRLREDSCQAAAKPIFIKGDANISAKDANRKLSANRISEGASGRCAYDDTSVKIVIVGTGCHNVDRVMQVLEEVDGNVDAAIEFLIAAQELDEGEFSVTSPCEILDGNGEDRTQSFKETSPSKEIESMEDADASGRTDNDVQGNKLSNKNKMDPSNKEPFSGSKKKVKDSKSTTREKSKPPVIRGKNVVNKNRKETKKGKSKETIKEVTGHETGTLQDLGALCI